LLLPLLEISSLRDIVDKYGGNSENSIEYLLSLIKEGINQSVRCKYRAGEYYSSEEENSERTCILNHCFDIIGVGNKRVIDIKTIIIALINSHEEENPPIENSLWCDYRLQTTYNTLSHIAGEYIEAYV
jgi:hypothetical protein